MANFFTTIGNAISSLINPKQVVGQALTPIQLLEQAAIGLIQSQLETSTIGGIIQSGTVPEVQIRWGGNVYGFTGSFRYIGKAS